VKSTAVRVLSEESVRLMRSDRLTDEQKRHPFLGMPFWIGRGFGLKTCRWWTDPAKSRQLFGPGGVGTFSWARGPTARGGQADPSENLILIYLIQNLPNIGADAAGPPWRANTSLLKLSIDTNEVRAPDLIRRSTSSDGYPGAVPQPTVP